MANLIAFWDDTRIATGDDWGAEIDQALADATAAVLLISQHFVASDFITHRELPRLLARADAGALKILPVFLRHSTVDLTRYAYVDPGSGEKRRVNLTKYQGFGSPDKPLMDLTWSQREKIFKQLARRLGELAGRPEPAVEPLRRVLPRRPEAPEATPARAFELTVEMVREGDNLGVRYHLPGLGPAYACPTTRYLDLDGSFDLPWDPAAGGFVVEDGRLRITGEPGLGVRLVGRSG